MSSWSWGSFIVGALAIFLPLKTVMVETTSIMDKDLIEKAKAIELVDTLSEKHPKDTFLIIPLSASEAFQKHVRELINDGKIKVAKSDRQFLKL